MIIILISDVEILVSGKDSPKWLDIMSYCSYWYIGILGPNCLLVTLLHVIAYIITCSQFLGVAN